MTAEPIFSDEEIECSPLPEDLSISEWSEKYRVLGTHSAIRGPYMVDMVPFFGFLMDQIKNENTQILTLCKPAQIGGTDMALNIIGYYAHQEGCPIMVVLADQDTAEYVSNEKIKVMLESSETLLRLIDPGTYTKIEMKLRNGAYIAIGWASSVAKLASRPIRIVVLDEIDKPGYNISSREANPISLARERTNTFPDRKIIQTSTPTTEDGNIIRELESCDVIYDWHVPCPSCGQFQPLRWSNGQCYGFENGMYRDINGDMRQIGRVVWEGGRNATNQQIQETSRYECGECKALWATTQKNDAVRLGKGIPRTPLNGFERKIGFHVNRIYSLFDGGRLEELVHGWCEAFRFKGLEMATELQGFLNSALAEPYRRVLVETKIDHLIKAKTSLPAQTVPAEAVALTCAVDVQKHGRWFVVRAWAQDSTSWLIHYGLVPGWPEIETLLYETTYPVVDSGQRMGLWRACVDIGGGDTDDGLTMTEDTEIWLHQHQNRGLRIWGVKGSSHALGQKCKVGSNLVKTPSGKPLPGGLQIVMLDTDRLKEAFLYRLDQAAQGHPQGSYLHADTDDMYFSHITAEQKQRDPKTGREEWKKIRSRNDLLDCESMSLALIDSSWPVGGINLFSPKQRAAPSRSIDTETNQQSSRPVSRHSRNSSAGRRVINPWSGRRGS